VNGRHQSFLDAEAFFQQNVNKQREAIRCATRVGNDMVLRRVVYVFIHAHHNRRAIAAGHGGNDDFFGTRREMPPGFFHVGKKASGLNDHFHAERFPRQFRRRFGADNFNFPAVDDKNIVLRSVVGRFF
jgi:hypothetical protein